MATAERPVTTARVAEYMQRPYLMEVVWDDDYWAATFPELPGLVAAANTWADLEQKIADAKESYFGAALEAGLPIAEPGDRIEAASGRVLLRLPKTLHWQAMRAAARDGVSVNTFLVSAVARELGRREAHQVPTEPPRIETQPPRSEVEGQSHLHDLGDEPSDIPDSPRWHPNKYPRKRLD